MRRAIEVAAAAVFRWLGGVHDGLVTRPLLAVLLALGSAASLAHAADVLPADGWQRPAVAAMVLVATAAVVLQWLASIAAMRTHRHFFRDWAGWNAAHLVAVIAIAASGSAAVGVAAVYVLAVSAVRLFNALLRAPLFGGNPARSLIFTFAAIILIGTAVLHVSPRTVRDGHSLSFIDALFTATSATCVNGLEVASTVETFTPFGQGVILGLIQIGGLGIMTFGTFLLLTVGRDLSLRDARHVQGVLDVATTGGLKRLVRFIFITTLGIEAIGAMLLFPYYAGSEAPVFESVFHSVSSFCNAGIGLRTDSLRGFAGAPGLNAVVMILIVLGGLGFTVLDELWRRLSTRPEPGMPRRRLSLHTRLVLVSSLVLTVAGAIGFWLLERDGVLLGRGVGGGALAATFQSVSARSSGFSTVPFGGPEGISEATRTFLVPLMGIGASPGSAGGGMKTVTFAILTLAVVSFLRGREHVEIWGRRIAPDIVKRCSAIALMYAVTLFCGVFALQLSDGASFSLEQIVFEATSALATVGYSVDVTVSDALSDTGKIVFVLLMFLGRLGPLTLVLVTSIRRDFSSSIRYPEERVMVG